ncbi:hypothetical protein D3C79_987350 [compost metagenome]
MATTVTMNSTSAEKRVARPINSNNAHSNSAHIDSCQLKLADSWLNGKGKADWS